MTAQAPCIGVTHMVDPALDAGIEFSERDRPGLVQINIMFQSPPELDDIAPLEAAVGRVDDETQPGNSHRTGDDLRC